MCACACACVHVRVCVCADLHTYIHTYIHTCIYVYMFGYLQGMGYIAWAHGSLVVFVHSVRFGTVYGAVLCCV